MSLYEYTEYWIIKLLNIKFDSRLTWSLHTNKEWMLVYDKRKFLDGIIQVVILSKRAQEHNKVDLM